ncbi:endonuclease [Sphingomonas sp. Leaf22]|uniref:DNA/RNA non-specific endonuclease n=1 Tax=Sphingomonas sp. Leaf22 TaxID=1735687 RepID=UPI0006FF4AE4|nr:DNA/RNA non-specific endonuclease [Sphingomonas sp. Leaf22]KQM89544.1 endonuclease [Sphingomonas sp. Leaf22]
MKIDLLYRPRLNDLRPVVPASETLLPFDAATVRTSPNAYFQGRQGYRADHLGEFVVPLPSASAIADDVLPIVNNPDARLDYEHFSIVMSRSRRLALFTGVNIDGSASVSVPRGGDPWAFDGRIPEDAQVGEALYANNDFDRGHLVRREDPNWGTTAGIANRDTFHFTNCAPQLSAFNQRTWLSLEDYILDNTRRVGERASVFTGPVFRATDPLYRGVAIPLAYWKVVAFVHDDGRPSSTAYLIDHDVDLTEHTLLFGAFKTYQRSVRAIEGLTDLDFGMLHTFDGFSNEEAATGESVRRLITGPGDILA